MRENTKEKVIKKRFRKVSDKTEKEIKRARTRILKSRFLTEKEARKRLDL